MLNETAQKRLAEITALLNTKPEYRTPNAVSSLMQAASARVLLGNGKIALPAPIPEPDEVVYARDYIDDYSEYVHGFRPEAFHLRWLSALTNPAIKRLLIIAPPDHGKTQYTSVEYPAFCIGKNPNIHIGFLSNTSTQAERRSLAVRDTIAFNQRYHRVFPNVKPDRKGWSSAEWYVQRDDPGDKDSTFKASGVFGPITGDRYDLLIMDDIVDQENAATEYQREKLREWIEVTALTRVVPGGKAVCIMTRFHHEDVASYFMKLGWHVIHTPALTEVPDPVNGGVMPKALWEDRWSVAELLKKRAESPLMFEKVYQGRPTPTEGALIKEHWWRFYDELPPEQPIRLIQALDTASKIKTMNDYSVIATWALYATGDVYLVDLVRDKLEYPQLKATAVSQFQRYRPHAVIIESASSGIALFQELRTTTSMPVREVTADRDKAARVMAVIDYIATGRCYLPSPSRAPWVAEFIREHAEFPLSAHDDTVDTTALALAELYLNKWARVGFLHMGADGGLPAAAVRVRARMQDMIAP